MLPSLFVAHGAPILALETGGYAKTLSELSNEFERPSGIVIYSSHWEYPAQTISGVEKFEMNHDFNGFPQDLYDIHYPAHGDMELTKKVKALFDEQKIYNLIDYNRKMDSSCWVVLRQMYPEANIPVVMLSINAHMVMEKQYEIGKTLQSLRDENILIIGSGGTVHNPELLIFEQKEPVTWAVEYDDWLEEQVAAWDLEKLFDYIGQAPNAKKAAPRSEHMIPLFLAMGAADNARTSKLLHRSYRFGSLSRMIWQFG